MVTKSNLNKLIYSILPYILVFTANLHLPKDPDLGWHLKYGEYFVNNFSILKENTFSSQMQGFIWTNISWGTDVITYLIYNLGGFPGLVVSSALAAAGTYYFLAKAFSLDFWQKALIFPIILFFQNPIYSNSFRGHLLSLFFLSILIYLLYSLKENWRNIYLIPILFMFWANIHGLFILGLAVLFMWLVLDIASDYFQKRSAVALLPNLQKYTILLFTAVLATLIHPYGTDIYKDVFKHFNNPLLTSVSEYLPAETLSVEWYGLYFTAVLAFIGIFVFIFSAKWKKQLTEIGIFSILFTLSVFIKRYMWQMYYFLIPFLKPLVNFLRPNAARWTNRVGAVLLLFFITLVLYMKQPLSQFQSMNWDIYCSKFIKCSPKSAEVLALYYKEGESMTLYNWGGWLIWNYPEFKPSTDGRMHLWRDAKGFSAFENDYNFEQNIKDIDTSKYNVVFTGNFKPIYSRMDQLVSENKWRLVYKDDTSAIFERN